MQENKLPPKSILLIIPTAIIALTADKFENAIPIFPFDMSPMISPPPMPAKNVPSAKIKHAKHIKSKKRFTTKSFKQSNRRILTSHRGRR